MRLTPLFRDPDLLIKIDLTAVRFIGNTDHIVTLGEQIGIFGKLVDGGQKNAAAIMPLQESPQLGAAFDADHRVVTDIALGSGKLGGKLIIQIAAVGNQHNGRAGETNAFHQEPGQKEHGKTLAAAGGTEIGAALAVPFRAPVFPDVLVQLGGRVILRITAENFFILFRGVGEKDKIADDVPQSVAIKHPPDHGIKGINALLLHRIAAVDLAPGVKKLIGSEKGTGLVVHSVTDHTEGVVLEQLRDVPHVANCELNKGVMNGGFFTDGALELKDNQRQAVDIQNAISNALFITCDFKLIDDLVNVGACMICRGRLGNYGCHLSNSGSAERSQFSIINKLNIEVFLTAVFTFEQEAVGNQFHDRLVALVKIGGGKHLQLADNGINLAGGDVVVCVLLSKKVSQVFLDQDFGRIAGNIPAKDTAIIFFFKKFDDRLF